MRQGESNMLARGGGRERPPAAAADSWRGLTLMPPSVLPWATAVARDEVDTAVTAEPSPVWRSSGAERSMGGRHLVPESQQVTARWRQPTSRDLGRFRRLRVMKNGRKKPQNASSNNCHGLGLWLRERIGGLFIACCISVFNFSVKNFGVTWCAKDLWLWHRVVEGLIKCSIATFIFCEALWNGSKRKVPSKKVDWSLYWFLGWRIKSFGSQLVESHYAHLFCFKPVKYVVKKLWVLSEDILDFLYNIFCINTICTFLIFISNYLYIYKYLQLPFKNGRGRLNKADWNVCCSPAVEKHWFRSKLAWLH